MLEKGTAIYQIIALGFEVLSKDVMFPHFDIGDLNLFQKSCVKVGCNNLARRANSLRQPPGNGP